MQTKCWDTGTLKMQTGWDTGTSKMWTCVDRQTQNRQTGERKKKERKKEKSAIKREYSTFLVITL